MKKTTLTIICLALLFSSCTKNKLIIDPDNSLIGLWNYSDFSNNTYIYARSQEFVETQGYIFNPDGTLTERNITGWCATPPLSFSDNRGDWSIKDDTLITVNVEYWGGTRTYMLDIESITADSLKLVYILVN